VKQLLDVSRLETGRLRLERAPAELTALIDDVIVSLGPREGTERIVVEGKEPVVANVDRLRVEQVIGNLLDNALKYGVDGPIVVRVSRDDRSATVAIADQGAGIPPEGGSRFILTLPLDPDTSSGDLEPAHRQLPLVDLGPGAD